MITGSKLSVPHGSGELVKDVVYYFLVNDAAVNRVRLVQFGEEGESAHLITLTGQSFEQALRAGSIVELEGMDSCPPWLIDSDGLDTAYRERKRSSPKETYHSKVDRRFLVISELVEKASSILASENVEAIINAHALRYEPIQNKQRVRLWFLTYMVFGRNKWALMPRTKNIGRWDRNEKTTKKLGGPSSDGSQSGFPVTPDMKAKILFGYKAETCVRRTQSEIYGAVLTKTFKCKIRRIGNDVKFYNPKGLPFPTINQFWYWVNQLTNPSSLATELKGKALARVKSGSHGKFADSLSNLNQVVEFDGYNPEEKLKGLTEGSAVDGFTVVRAVCVFSAAVVGIGFARSSEDMEAYRMALFSMAVDKVKFAELFGVTIQPGRWPALGLPLNIVFDRGPAATMPVEEASDWLARIELTPTHDGQAKATVESSHVKKKKNKDQQRYVHSTHNFVEMSRRHILQVIKDNDSSNAEALMHEEMLSHNFAPSPTNIWRYWDQLGRNRGTYMGFDDAVRKFLTLCPATILRDGVYFHGRRYISDALVEAGVFDRVARNGRIAIKAYALTMCVRHIWVEVDGRLHELNFFQTAGTKPSSSDITLYELEELGRLRAASIRRLKAQKPVIDQEVNGEFKDQTGKEWHGGTAKLGRRVKNASVRRDQHDYNLSGGKKS